MCPNIISDRRGVKTYDVIKYIGNVLGYHMVDVLDVAFNDNVQGGIFITVDPRDPDDDDWDDEISIHYTLEINEDLLEGEDTDDDSDSTTDMTIDELHADEDLDFD